MMTARLHTLALLVFLCGSATALRAQFSESPGTVARGGWLMETDVVSIAYDRHTPWRDGVHYRSTYLGYAQVTTGLAQNLDLQLGWDVWREERATGMGVDERARGAGEVYLRSKWQFWQTDGGAVALLPYVRLRGTADSSLRPARTQFGLIVPWETAAGPEWTLGGQLQADWLEDGAGGRDAWLTATLFASRMVTGRLGIYVEGMAYYSPRVARNWATLAGGGATWQVTESFSWDAGFLVGFTRAAPDFNPVLRFVWAF